MKHIPEVDEYINSLPAWQQEVCTTLREVIHESNQHIQETIKRKNLPYFVLDGNICALLAAKDHVNLFIYDPIAEDPEHVINQGHDNATARSIQIHQDQPINTRGIKKLLENVITNNQAGGWRRRLS